MYGELGAVRGVVDLSPEHALDEAEAFLAFLGYSILRRTSTTLTAQRRSSEEPVGEGVPNLTVVAMPQPEGGVQIKIRGSDFEGVQARQTEWMGWSESLPRKGGGEVGVPTDVQGGIQTPEVELPPPPTVESPTLPAPAPAADAPVPPPQPPPTTTAPPPPRRESTVWRGTKLVFGGCVVLPVLLVIGFVGCLALFASGGGGNGEVAGGGNQAQQDQKEQPAQEQQQPAKVKQQPAQGEQANEGQNKSYGIGDTVPVGDVSYRITGAKRVRQLPDPYRIDPPMKGNFILITFVFTNNGNEAANVSDIGLYLYDSQNREYETDTDATMNLPQDKSIFLLDRVNPGLSRTVQTVYSVPPDAKGFELEVTSGFWANESARISLGF